MSIGLVVPIMVVVIVSIIAYLLYIEQREEKAEVTAAIKRQQALLYEREEQRRIKLQQQRADIEQVYSLIDRVEQEWDGDDGPLAVGARNALVQLRKQLELRFGKRVAWQPPPSIGSCYLQDSQGTACGFPRP